MAPAVGGVGGGNVGERAEKERDARVGHRQLFDAGQQVGPRGITAGTNPTAAAGGGVGGAVDGGQVEEGGAGGAAERGHDRAVRHVLGQGAGRVGGALSGELLCVGLCVCVVW